MQSQGSEVNGALRDLQVATRRECPSLDAGVGDEHVIYCSYLYGRNVTRNGRSVSFLIWLLVTVNGGVVS